MNVSTRKTLRNSTATSSGPFRVILEENGNKTKTDCTTNLSASPGSSPQSTSISTVRRVRKCKEILASKPYWPPNGQNTTKAGKRALTTDKDKAGPQCVKILRRSRMQNAQVVDNVDHITGNGNTSIISTRRQSNPLDPTKSKLLINKRLTAP